MRALNHPRRRTTTTSAAGARQAPSRRPARAAVAIANSLTVKDKESGVEFPLGQTFWCGWRFCVRSQAVCLRRPRVWRARTYKHTQIRGARTHTNREGQECHCLGSGTRSKKILMVGVKVSE